MPNDISMVNCRPYERTLCAFTHNLFLRLHRMPQAMISQGAFYPWYQARVHASTSGS